MFHQHITAAEVDRLISQVVKRPSGNAGDTEDPKLALSHNDFRAFIRAFLERGRTEPVWRILQYYGYNTQLNLDTAYIRPKVGMSADGNECVELSLAGIAFLSSLWQDFQEQVRALSIFMPDRILKSRP